MMAIETRRADEALDWLRRIQDPHFTDWDAHIAWLEADARNADALDRMALAMELAVASLDPVAATSDDRGPVNDNAGDPAPDRPRRRRWFGTGLGLALAAGIVGVIGLPSFRGQPAATTLIGTRPGEMRIVTLADGSRVALNGDTVLRLDAAESRVAALLHGEAFFTVVHDPAHPFVVRAGTATFQDVGTAFDVTQDRDRTRVAVREGAVLYDPAATALRLDRGKAIEIARDQATVRGIDAATVGGWRSGRLTYKDAPMTEVAADLSRSIGRPVALDPRLAARRFSGVIVVDPDRQRMFDRVAAVTGVEVGREGAGWRMAPATR